jgi:hypothetical protein
MLLLGARAFDLVAEAPRIAGDRACTRRSRLAGVLSQPLAGDVLAV